MVSPTSITNVGSRWSRRRLRHARGDALGSETREQLRIALQALDHAARARGQLGEAAADRRRLRGAPPEKPANEACGAALRLVGHRVTAARAVLRRAAADRDRAAVLLAGVAAGLVAEPAHRAGEGSGRRRCAGERERRHGPTPIPVACMKTRTRPPVAKAKGKMKAAIAAAVFKPCSLRDHEEVRDAGHEERDRHHRDEDLHRVEAAAARPVSNEPRRRRSRGAGSRSGTRPTSPAAARAQPVTSGSPARMTRRGAQPVEQEQDAACPTTKSGIASFRYHSSRPTVFDETLLELRAAASAELQHEVARSPGSTRAASQPTDHTTSDERQPDHAGRERRLAIMPAARRAGPSRARRAPAA